MNIDKKSLMKRFPNLIREFELENGKIRIDSTRSDSEFAEESSSDRIQHFDPTVIDFIRRCSSNNQAEEIISYLEKRGEISPEYAKNLRVQLRKRGVRSFGSKKEDDYYFKKGGLC